MSIKRSTDDRFVMLGDWITTIFIALLGVFLIYWLLNYSLWLSLILTAAFAVMAYLRIRLVATKMLVADIDKGLTKMTALSQGYEEGLKMLEAKVRSQ